MLSRSRRSRHALRLKSPSYEQRSRALASVLCRCACLFSVSPPLRPPRQFHRAPLELPLTSIVVVPLWCHHWCGRSFARLPTYVYLTCRLCPHHTHYLFHPPAVRIHGEQFSARKIESTHRRRQTQKAVGGLEIAAVQRRLLFHVRPRRLVDTARNRMRRVRPIDFKRQGPARVAVLAC